MRREVVFLGQEQPPTEQETGASLPVPPLADIAGVPSSRRSVGVPSEDIVEHVPRRAISTPRESSSTTLPAVSGCQVLRLVVTALPGIETLRLWACQPAQRAEAARFTEISAIHKEQNQWLAIAPQAPLEAAEQQALSTLAERLGRETSTHPVASVLHFPEAMLIVCRTERGDVRGVLEALLRERESRGGNSFPRTGSGIGTGTCRAGARAGGTPDGAAVGRGCCRGISGPRCFHIVCSA